MRKVMVVVFAVASFGPLAGSAAAAGPDLPSVPQNCHEWNELLHIDNVQSCDGA